jgi:hypothetical protein
MTVLGASAILGGKAGLAVNTRVVYERNTHAKRITL